MVAATQALARVPTNVMRDIPTTKVTNKRNKEKNKGKIFEMFSTYNYSIKKYI